MGDQIDWILEVNDELHHMEDVSRVMEHWKKRSIYKVPTNLTDRNKKAYKPQTVSFGPYHHDEPHLKPMEEHKRRALLHFLKRSKEPLQSYVNSLAEVVQELKDSYDSLDQAWQENTNRFLQLMIFDGCFMLEIFRAFTGHWDDYTQNDPIFSRHGMLHFFPYIKRDMLLLENQLPMLVLNRLLAVGIEEAKQDEEFVNKLILKFCSPNVRTTNLSLGECLHVLDVYRKSLLWEEVHRRKHQTASRSFDGDTDIIRSATKLNKAGIRFNKSKTLSLKDISFYGGVLRLPPIVVDELTEPLFLNLIVFEKYHVGTGNEVTSYIFFMYDLIYSVKDVSLLHSRGIIQNAMESDKAVVDLFNSLSKDVTLDPDCSINEVCQKLNYYCRKRWMWIKCRRRMKKWQASLMKTYFRSPWAVLSVIAASFLLALTTAQTIYTILSYYKQSPR